MLELYLKFFHNHFLSNVVQFIIHVVALRLMQIINHSKMNEVELN
jgi:hypothetical protein